MSESETDLSVASPVEVAGVEIIDVEIDVEIIDVEIIDERDLQPDDDRQIRELLCLCFPDWAEIFQQHRLWHNTPPVYSVIVRGEEQIIGHIAVVVRTITTTWNFRYNVASIQGVCVSPDQRRVGVSRLLIQKAVQEAARREFLFAILYCKEFLVPFYTSQGWKLADDSVVMWNSKDLPISMRSNCPMFLELTETPFPEGPLDVHSPLWQ